MPEYSGEKTQDATPHRRQQAREKGQVAFSHDLGSAALLIVGVLLLMLLGGALIEFTVSILHQYLGQAPALAPDSSLVLGECRSILGGLAKALLPFLGLVVLAAIFTNVLQIGLLWVPERLAPDLSRLSPLQGFRRIFSLSGTMRLGFGLFKVSVIGGVAASVLWTRRDDILRSGEFDALQLSHFLVDISLSTTLWIGLALLLLALFDYAFQRWKHENDLRMTHQEVREEMKNLQGDPHIIARRRSVQRQLVLNRLSSIVPKADVIVTNPTELAIALQYEPEEMAAPVVIAKGAGVLAQRIRRLALEHNIPIVERKPLAQLLYKEVDVNRPIPDKTYAAVAEVLAYVYQLKGKKLPKPPARAA